MQTYKIVFFLATILGVVQCRAHYTLHAQHVGKQNLDFAAHPYRLPAESQRLYVVNTAHSTQQPVAESEF